MQQYVEAAREYLSHSGDDYALIVNSVTGAPDDAALELRENSYWRKYLPSKRSQERLERLLDQLEQKLSQLTEAGHPEGEAVPFLLRDIGYTDNGPSRLQNHENAQSSANKMLALFYAISKSSEDLQSFDLYGEVIFLGFQDIHASLAEAVFSLLAQSYVETGMGFNSVQAGIQITSNRKYGLDEHQKFRADILANSPFYANVAAERQRIQQAHAHKAHLEEQI